MHSIVNSNGYWDRRFRENWEELGGREQSRFFARLAVARLPSWLFQNISRRQLSVAVWGCAQGDGTDFLATYIDSSRLTGVDFSVVATEQAAQRYPHLSFLQEDWLEDSTNPSASYDVVFSSNVLEHFHRPYVVLEKLARRARKVVALVLPFREIDRIHE